MTKNITCLADAINHVPRVRVIKEGNKFHGEEFDIVINDYENQEITIREDKYNLVVFPYSKVQFLTPVQYEGRYIGLGDKVNGYEVFGFHWYDEEFVVDVNVENYDLTYYLCKDNITSFEPLHKLTPKIELSTEELLDELKRRGVVTNGNIINHQ